MRTWKTVGTVVMALVAFLAAPWSARAQGGFTGTRPMPEPGQSATGKPGLINEIRIDQKFDSQVPPDLAFVDEDGQDVRIGEYFGTRPVILALVYYECPMLCTQVLTGLVTALGVLDMKAGQDYDVVVASIDHLLGTLDPDELRHSAWCVAIAADNYEEQHGGDVF